MAANQARATLLAGEWPGAHIPVLFMRMADGRLLTPSPARAALAAISADEDFAWFAPASQSYLPLPVEAVHVTGEQNIHRFDAQPVEPTATIDVLKALGQIYPASDAAQPHRPNAPQEASGRPSSSERAPERERRRADHRRAGRRLRRQPHHSAQAHCLADSPGLAGSPRCAPGGARFRQPGPLPLHRILHH
ncbi:MAG: hypothetical protein V9H69_05210 [Anaerolineae bacterium]